MCSPQKKNRSFFRPLIYLALLLFCNNIYPQKNSSNDTIIHIKPGAFIQIRDSISFFSNDTLLRLPSSLIPASMANRDKNIIFFDSLKIRASKNHFTRKLYDFVIVSPDTIQNKKITGTSDASYISFSGKRIRKIEIRRLNVFGANINNPASSEPSTIENILNKTHANTNEKIIRKNLLFSEGDTISPLTLSDNERILRQLSYIDDARIIIVPVSDEEADIVVVTKDVYSLGAVFSYDGIKRGSVSVFDKNIFGMGHEFGVDIPYDSEKPDSPGFGVHYVADNIRKSFINLNVFYLDGLGEKTYGISLNRKLMSSSAKYAGGIAVRQMYTTEDLGTLPIPEPLKYNYQDYWLQRSFLLNKEKVSRIIIGGRYTNNNIFTRPFILPDSYYDLTKYRIFLASAAFSIQKYYKSNLIYGYGRTEDIPYGGLFRFTAGNEYNEFHNFRKRTYFGAEISTGRSFKALGYFYTSAGFATYLDHKKSEQGVLTFNLNYFSNLVTMGRYMIRNFVNAEYTRGFNRNTQEFLVFIRDNGFSGFKNDSVIGTQRLSVNLETVLFSPVNLYGFRFAFFAFADLSLLSGTNQIISHGTTLSSIGIGIRIRNDNLIFNTFQIRLGFFPNPPSYSKISYLTFSGEQLLRPNNFDSGPPSIIPYR
jgi:hypothetical protein